MVVKDCKEGRRSFYIKFARAVDLKRGWVLSLYPHPLQIRDNLSNKCSHSAKNKRDNNKMKSSLNLKVLRYKNNSFPSPMSLNYKHKQKYATIKMIQKIRYN